MVSSKLFLYKNYTSSIHPDEPQNGTIAGFLLTLKVDHQNEENDPVYLHARLLAASCTLIPS